MGMFDDIIVPKSYLKDLLTKEQEKLIKDNNYQTKSLENFLKSAFSFILLPHGEVMP